MNYISKNKIKYLGVDEHSPPFLRGGFIVAIAETTEKKLTEESSTPLKKAKDYLIEANHLTADKRIKSYKNMPCFPSIDEFKNQGLENFYWMRANNGRFSRQLVEHASIAHVIASNGYKPSSTVILIDAFYGKNDMSIYLIQEYLKTKNFNIPRENIKMIGGGDKSIPIINFADILAFQIGLYLNKKYLKYNNNGFRFEIDTKQVDYNLQRVLEPIDKNGRDNLEKAIKRWHGHKN